MPVFLVENGSGSPLSTSYADVVYADEYLSLTPSASSSVWATLSVADRQKYLMYASRLMDQTLQYVGDKQVETSGLRWPRFLAYDCDGIEQDKTKVPDAIKDTAVEIADFYSRNTDIVAFDKTADEAGLESIKVDVIQIKWKKDVVVSEENKYPWYVENVLQCLGVIRFRGGMLKRGSRFKPIGCA